MIPERFRTELRLSRQHFGLCVLNFETGMSIVGKRGSRRKSSRAALPLVIKPSAIPENLQG